MIHVLINENFFLEKKYIIEVLLEEFLGFNNYKIIISNNEDDYVLINTLNKKKIIVKDAFFKDKLNEYLSKENLPSKPIQYNYSGVEYSFPYGKSMLFEEEDTIICHLDVFSSSYFFLSRWEEFVIVERDKHKRFIDENSWIVKNQLQHRSLVNEYANLLSVFLVKIGVDLTCTNKFTPIITHDIDLIARYDSGKKIIKAIGGDLLLRKSLFSLIKTIKEVIGIFFFKQKDPYDTFDFLMDLSESVNVKSHFYFIAGVKSEYDVRYNFDKKKVIDIYDRIKKRGHIIGLHPSYNSFLNFQQLKLEKVRLESKIGLIVKEGRQHYLRINLPDSWRLWEHAELIEDSSVGFNSCFGFRTGSCYKYSVYDFVNRKKLKLKENPLLVMEVASKYYDKLPMNILEDIKIIIDEVKKHNGNFTFLWHNNSFPTKKHFQVYNKIIELLQ